MGTRGLVAVAIFVGLIIVVESLIVVGFNQGVESQTNEVMKGLNRNTQNPVSITMTWFQKNGSVFLNGTVSPSATYYLSCTWKWDHTPLGGYCQYPLVTTNQNGNFSVEYCGSCGWAIPTVNAITVSYRNASATVTINCWGATCSHPDTR